jgi:hypothetical protein
LTGFSKRKKAGPLLSPNITDRLQQNELAPATVFIAGRDVRSNPKEQGNE